MVLGPDGQVVGARVERDALGHRPRRRARRRVPGGGPSADAGRGAPARRTSRPSTRGRRRRLRRRTARAWRRSPAWHGSDPVWPDHAVTRPGRRRERASISGWANEKPKAVRTRREHPLAGQEHLRHHLLAEHGVEGDLGRREHRRPVQRPAQRLGEVGVGDRVGGGDVHRALHVVGDSRWRMAPISSSRVIQLSHCRPVPSRPPSPILNGRSCFSSAPPFSLSTTPAAQPDDPDPGVGGRGGGRLPLLDHVGQEPTARTALLGELLVATVAVEADGRAGGQHPGRTVQAGQRRRQ